MEIKQLTQEIGKLDWRFTKDIGLLRKEVKELTNRINYAIELRQENTEKVNSLEKMIEATNRQVDKLREKQKPKISFLDFFKRK